MLRHDLIMQMVEAVGELARKVARRKREKAPETESLDDIATAYDDLFALTRDQVLSLEPRTVAALLRGDRELPWLVRVLRIDAETWAAAGHDGHATRIAQSAFALAAIAIRQQVMDRDAFDTIGALLALTDPTQLDLDDLETVQRWMA